ncbi:penicillin-binding protein 2 [Rossellomorea aquimaris]|nr:penicillin-binding protein 2 [Rossellomorea aquimaris]
MRRSKKKKKNYIKVRINILFFVIFLLFSSLLLRLGYVQIVSGEEYKRIVEQTEEVTVSYSVPRGKIYDRTGKVIVDNRARNAITYTPPQYSRPDEMLTVARKLAQYIEMDTEAVTTRDKKDFWILLNSEAADSLVTTKEKEEIKNNKDLTENESNGRIYRLILDRILEDDLNSLTEQDLEDLAIYREFSSGYALTPKIIKNKGVTEEEFAVVSEHLSELPGINTTTDWERTYPFDNTLRSILGKVSSSREGLPRENIDTYLARGYKRNDRVGTSQLELQYENVLRGQKEEIKNITKDGIVLKSVLVKKGERGKDLVITIDIDLQQAVEEIVTEELLKNVKQPRSSFLDRAYVVMIDPNTGEILALVGKRALKDEETGKHYVIDDALGTYTSFYEVGSAVKGATVLTGYMTGVLTPGQSLVDEPIKIARTPKKASWFNQKGWANQSMNDRFALEISSNSYMFKVAMRLAGNPYYVPHAGIKGTESDLINMRNHFNQLGLGVNTGIDLPGEVDGYQGRFTTPGNLLDFAIGQFDTYTPLQLAQYVSTVANGGYRIQPHILKEVRQPDTETGQPGPIQMIKETKVLNKVNVTPEQLLNVQKGFYQVYHNSRGTAASHFRNAPYVAAGKSGTAQSYHRDPKTGEFYDTYNTTLIGYAPYENPEIAFSTVVPKSHNSSTDPYINKEISRKVMDAYYKLKKKREIGVQEVPSELLEEEVESVDANTETNVIHPNGNEQLPSLSDETTGNNSDVLEESEPEQPTSEDIEQDTDALTEEAHEGEEVPRGEINEDEIESVSEPSVVMEVQDNEVDETTNEEEYFSTE